MRNKFETKKCFFIVKVMLFLSKSAYKYEAKNFALLNMDLYN